MIKSGDERLSGIDWDLLAEKQVPIKNDYYTLGTKIAAGNIAEAWVETGIEGGKITRNAPTYFEKPLNEGKTNERNVFQNALIYARSQWLRRKQKGNVESEKATTDTNDTSNVMYFPMLAKKYDDAGKHLVFPLYVQPKLDGVRCLMYLQKKNGGAKSVVAYTRTKKPFPSIEYVKEAAYPYLNALYDEKKNQSIYLDGELYKHGKKLQDISGDSRNAIVDTSDDNKKRNEYHIYDCFYPKELNRPYYKRYAQLKLLYNALSKVHRTVLKSVPTYLVKNMSEAEKKYREFTKMGYEGAMLRNKNGPYLANATKTGAFLRSNDLVKMKPRFSDEYEVVGYAEGERGKDKGAIIWVCQTTDGKQFNVTPKDTTYEERYELFRDAEQHFDNKYRGRMLTVEYEDLSKDDVPLRAKALTFRDYE
jgi:ATP-dependent DNA ligase